MVDIFSTFLLELEIYCQDKFQKLSQLTNWIFFSYMASEQIVKSDKKQQKCRKF